MPFQRGAMPAGTENGAEENFFAKSRKVCFDARKPGKDG